MIKKLQILVQILQAMLSCYAIYYILNKWRIERLVKCRVASSYKR